MALTFTPKLDSSFKIPHFSAKTVEGKTFSTEDFAKNHPIWIMFICNHCPYVKAIESRILETAHQLIKEGYQVLAICSNDATEYPEDSTPALLENWKNKKFPFPYLVDETQQIAKDFNAVCTPDFYLFDKDHQLRYRGRLDDSWKNPEKVKRQELLSAALQIKNSDFNIKSVVPSMGCSIKWKE